MTNPAFKAPNYTTQTAATYKANIDASIAANGADYVNLGFTYSVGTGVLTVHDALGVALSSANPAFVRFQDKAAPGQSVVVSVEANQAFIDDNGASEIINNLFGTTTAIAWAKDVPFYLYAVVNDAKDAVAFMISRVPHMSTSPVVGLIGAPDDAVADDEYAFFSFDNIDETLYDSNPCTVLGSFRMQKTSSDDWTVQTLTTNDGIGNFQDNIHFDMPLNQNGAATGTYFLANSGTAPIWTINFYSYVVERSGNCDFYFRTSGDGGTDGIGAVSALVALPFKASSLGFGTDLSPIASGFSRSAVKGDDYTLATVDSDDGGRAMSLATASNLATMLNQDFAAGSRLLNLSGQFKLEVS